MKALAKLSERSKGLGKLQGPEQQAENSKEELPKGTPKVFSNFFPLNQLKSLNFF